MLGLYRADGIKQDIKGQQKVTILFKVDVNGHFRAERKDSETG